jgi:hypothetical protein
LIEVLLFSILVVHYSLFFMTEDQIELLAVELLKESGYDYVHGSAMQKLMSGKIRVEGVENA